MYLFKLPNVSIQIEEKKYLFLLQNIFVQIAKCICPSVIMHAS